MFQRHRIPLFLSALLLASTAGAEDAAGPKAGLVSVEADDGPMVSIQIAASDASAPAAEPVPAPTSAAQPPAAATPFQAPAPEEGPAPEAAPAPDEAPAAAEAPAPAQASAPAPSAAPGEEPSAAEQVMSEPSLLPGISYEEALEQIDEWQAYIASQHEAMRKQAEERRALLEKRREEMLKQAKERQEKMIEYYDSMYKKAQERRTFLEENQDNFMKEDLERQSGLSEYHQEMLNATEERRAELAAKRAEIENMPLQDIRAYLAEIRKQTLEDAKSLEMEGVRAPTPPPWPDAPSYESRQGQVGRPGRGWQSPQYGPGVMDYPMMGPGGRDYPMGPPTELGNPPFGDWGPRSGFPKGGFGRPGMRTGPGMGNPGMGNPGMGNPGMGNPGMGNPGMGNPGMGRPGPQSSMTPDSGIGQEAAPPPVVPKGNASATNPEPVSRYRRPGGYPPPQFGWAPAYRLPYPAGHRSRAVGAAHPARHQLASWRPLPRTFRPRVRHPQLAWWPSRYIPQAVVAANRFGAHPFPIAYAGPRGPMQSGAYPARQMAKRFTPAHPAKRLRPAPSFAGNWTYRPYAG